MIRSLAMSALVLLAACAPPPPDPSWVHTGPDAAPAPDPARTDPARTAPVFSGPIEPGPVSSSPSEVQGSGPVSPDAVSPDGAFDEVHARLGYADERLEYDARGCAVYRATAPDGGAYTERLRSPSGAFICR